MRTYEEVDAELSQILQTADRSRLLLIISELEELNDPRARILALNTRGSDAMNCDDLTTAMALFKEALTLAQELPNTVLRARVEGNIGTCLRRQGDVTAAIAMHHQALETFQQLGDRHRIGWIYSCLGSDHKTIGEVDVAYEMHARSLEIYTELGGQAGQMGAYINMAYIDKEHGLYTEAMAKFEKALMLAEQVGNETGESTILTALADIHVALEDYDRAFELFDRAIAIANKGKNESVQITAVMFRGTANARRGRQEEALSDLRLSVNYWENTESKDRLASSLSNLGQALVMFGLVDEAEQVLQRALDLTLQDPQGEVMRTNLEGRIHQARGNDQEAKDAFMRGLELATRHNIRHFMESLHEALKEVAKKQADIDSFVRHHDEAERIRQLIRGQEAKIQLAIKAKDLELQREREQAERERAVLYSALPPSIADRMIRGDDVSGDRYDNACVLFADIVGFTSHTSIMDPAETTKLLAVIFNRFDEICDQNGLTKIKTIGDSYMAVAFGSSASADTDEASVAIRTAEAALAMKALEFTWPDGSIVQFRIGGHAGPVVAGVIGTQRLQYDVWGDTVNVASRMESSGEAGRIHVSEAFATALHLNDSMTPDSMTLLERGVTDIKGKGLMATFWLVRAS